MYGAKSDDPERRAREIFSGAIAIMPEVHGEEADPLLLALQHPDARKSPEITEWLRKIAKEVER